MNLNPSTEAFTHIEICELIGMVNEKIKNIPKEEANGYNRKYNFYCTLKGKLEIWRDTY